MKKVLFLLLALSLFIGCEGLMNTKTIEGTWDAPNGSLYFNGEGSGDWTLSDPILFTYTYDESSRTGTITLNNGGGSGDFSVNSDYTEMDYNSQTYIKRD